MYSCEDSIVLPSRFHEGLFPHWLYVRLSCWSWLSQEVTVAVVVAQGWLSRVESVYSEYLVVPAVRTPAVQPGAAEVDYALFQQGQQHHSAHGHQPEAELVQGAVRLVHRAVLCVAEAVARWIAALADYWAVSVPV